MNVLGISPGVVLRVAREARDSDRAKGPILVVGPLAAHLARSLAEGGDPGLVGTAGDPASAAAVVCILGGAPKPDQRALLRAATRASVPTVAVQTGDAVASVPYVLAEDVVMCSPGRGFPVEEIAEAVVRGLGRDAAAMAAHLPVLRPAARRRLAVRGAGIAAGLAASPWGARAHLPLLVPLQARMLRDLDVAAGRPAPSSSSGLGAAVGSELGAALAVGVLARTFVRRLPLRSRLVDAAVAGGATLALGTLAARARP
jgi:uncharacterized protein (DUF697 family)